MELFNYYFVDKNSGLYLKNWDDEGCLNTSNIKEALMFSNLEKRKAEDTLAAINELFIGGYKMQIINQK